MDDISKRLEGMDEGADFCIRDLASQLGVRDWEQADGSEEWEGDVSGTIRNVLIAARIVDDEDGRIARLASSNPNDPEGVMLAGVDCFVYPAEQYAAVEADVADERKKFDSAAVVAREMARWAGVRSAENFRWLLDEMLADANRQHFKAGQTEGALKDLLFALHARPRPGYELLTVEEAIDRANALLDAKFARDSTS